MSVAQLPSSKAIQSHTQEALQSSLPPEKTDISSQLTCAKCSKSAQKLLICGSCRQVNYCDRECQKSDWGAHKIVCLSSKGQKSMECKPTPSISTQNEIDFSSKFALIPPSKSETFFENGRVFPVTNELKEDETLIALSKIGSVGNVLIATGGLSCFNLACARKNVNFVIVVDASKLTELFWKRMVPLIKTSKSKEDCQQDIYTHLALNLQDYMPKQYPPNVLNKLLQFYAKELSKPSSWLMDDLRFEKVKKILRDGHFAALKVNFTDTLSCSKIGIVLDNLALKVDTLYLSNIHDFISSKDYSKYAESLEALLCKDSIIVDTVETPFKTTKLLSQRFDDGGTLMTHVRLPLQFQGFEELPPDQRVRVRNGESIGDLYPIIKLQSDCEKLDELFYLYGLERGYYTEEEHEKLSQKVTDLFKPLGGITPQTSKLQIGKITTAAMFGKL